MSNKHKNRVGIVYSTNTDFEYQLNIPDEPDTLEPAKQQLIVKTDSKMRAGKIVTLIKGFVGKQSDLDALAKMLKTSCGAGGSTKDGEIIIQGNFADRIKTLLTQKGYRVK